MCLLLKPAFPPGTKQFSLTTLAGEGAVPWYSPSAHPGKHFTARTLRYQFAFRSRTRHASLDILGGILGVSARDKGGTWHVISAKPEIGDRKGTTKKLCDKDFAERSGELSGAICLKTLTLLGNDPVTPSIDLFRKIFGAVVRFLAL